MKKFLLISATTLFSILLLGAVYFYFDMSPPRDATVKREFSKIKPNAEIVGTELIFDFEPKKVLGYLVKYRESQDSEIKISDFALQRDKYFQWHWCDDQTERKCG